MVDRRLLAIGVGLVALRRLRARDPAEHTSWTPSRGRQVDGVLPARVTGDGRVGVVLLHGMFNSGRYWGGHYDVLAHRVVVAVPDLLGFGRAPKPASGYTADAHADAVAETLRALGVESPVVVGAHSVGGLVALRLAVRHPDLVGAIVAFAPPLYVDSAAARRQMSNVDPLARILVLNEGLGRRLCAVMCRYPKTAERLVRLTRPGLPPPLAADRVGHSWSSYRETLSNLVLAAEAAGWLDGVHIPVRLVAGGRDRAIDHDFLEKLASMHPQVSLRFVPDAGHDLPLSHPGVCLEELQASVSLSGCAGRP